MQLLDAAYKAADASEVDKAESQRAKAAIHTHRGRLHCDEGASNHGIEELEKALAFRIELGDSYLICTTLVNLAGTYLCDGQEKKAMVMYEEAAQVAKEKGSRKLPKSVATC